MWPGNQHCAPSNHALPPIISEHVRLSINPGLTISKMPINCDTFISFCWPSLIHLLNAHIWYLTIIYNIINIIHKNSWQLLNAYFWEEVETMRHAWLWMSEELSCGRDNKIYAAPRDKTRATECKLQGDKLCLRGNGLTHTRAFLCFWSYFRQSGLHHCPGRL